VGRFARAFDPTLVSTEAASSLLEQAAAIEIEAEAASLLALCADRAAEAPVEAIRQIIATDDPFLPAVVCAPL
jgi:hypothetical protein